ncbi:MAG: hypothetical protein FWF99_00150 [Desulfovibrionaceae bacterium]|nr:hypothetical protein [Desulfovibrionaceae bacterium]
MNEHMQLARLDFFYFVCRISEMAFAQTCNQSHEITLDWRDKFILENSSYIIDCLQLPGTVIKLIFEIKTILQEYEELHSDATPESKKKAEHIADALAETVLSGKIADAFFGVRHNA